MKLKTLTNQCLLCKVAEGFSRGENENQIGFGHVLCKLKNINRRGLSEIQELSVPSLRRTDITIRSFSLERCWSATII